MIGQYEDWKLVLSYLGKSDRVSIEVEVKSRGRRGNTFPYRERKQYSLMRLSAKQLFKIKSSDEIFQMVTNYFNTNLDKKYFILYCEFVERVITSHFNEQETTFSSIESLGLKCATLLKNIYSYFGNNLTDEIHFHVWKDGSFKFIEHSDVNQLEISEKILKYFVNEIGVVELKRIVEYSFGPAFCHDFINIKFNNLNDLTFDEIKSLYSYLEFASEPDREKFKGQLDGLYFKIITDEIIDQANKLESINNRNDLDNYIKLKQIAADKLSKGESLKVNNTLDEIIISKSSKEVELELWLEGIVVEVPFHFISKAFLDNVTSNEKRIAILSRSELKQQIELLKTYSDKYHWEKAFEFLECFVKKEDAFGYSFKLTEKLFDLEFWKDKKYYDLVIFFSQYATEKISDEIIYQANRLESINNCNDLNNFIKLKQIAADKLSKDESLKVNNILDEIIISKSSEEVKPELWLEGIIEEAPFQFILNLFIDNKTSNEKRIAILSRIELKQQIELLKTYSGKNHWEKAFEVLELLVKKEDALGCNFRLTEKLFDLEFWKDKKHHDLVISFSQYATQETTEEEKFDLFFEGYIQKVPQNLVKQKLHKLGEAEFVKLIFSDINDKNFINDILLKKITSENIKDVDWVVKLGHTYLDTARFSKLDSKLFDTLEQAEYFKFWKNGQCQIFPEQHIENILDDNLENYKQINNWVENKLITKEEICVFLLSYLQKQIPVTDRIIFYKQYNRIKYLNIIDPSYLKKISELKNDFYKVILWVLGNEKILDFDLLKSKFIYFSPEEQVKIIRKLFSLKAKNEFQFTIEKLDELTRIDLDLYKTNLYFNPSIPLDISTDVIIKSLLSYKQKQKFLVESELLTVVLNDLKEDKTRRFKLEHYFQNCEGREIAKFNWETNGEITKEGFGDNKFYFAITLPIGIFDFERVKEDVKKLPKRKWNRIKNHWGVPSKYEKEVLNFAREYRFFLNFEGSNYANNPHLAEFQRGEIPNGIIFCQGRLINNLHRTYQREFWWCAGQSCFQICETIHSPEEWENYTLLDFCNILGFNTDETHKPGDFIPKGTINLSD